MLHNLLTAAALAGVGWLIYRQEQHVATKDEILAQIGEVRNLLVETQKDVGRVADKLDEAMAGGDLAAVGEAIADLRGIAQTINDRAEQSSPEAVAPDEPTEPVEPTP